MMGLRYPCTAVFVIVTSISLSKSSPVTRKLNSTNFEYLKTKLKETDGAAPPVLFLPGTVKMNGNDIEYALELVSGKLRNVREVLSATKKVEDGKTLYLLRCLTKDGIVCTVNLTRHDDGSERTNLSCEEQPLNTDNTDDSENTTFRALSRQWGHIEQTEIQSETFLQNRQQLLSNLIELILKRLAKPPEDPGLSNSIVNSVSQGTGYWDDKSLRKDHGNSELQQRLLWKLDELLKDSNKQKHKRSQTILNILKEYFKNQNPPKNHKADATLPEVRQILNTADSVLTSKDRVENKYDHNSNKQKKRNQLIKEINMLEDYYKIHPKPPKKYEFRNLLKVRKISNTADSVLTINDHIQKKNNHNLNKQTYDKTQLMKQLNDVGKNFNKKPPKKYEDVNKKKNNELRCTSILPDASFEPGAGCMVEELPKNSFSSLENFEAPIIADTMLTNSLTQMTDHFERDVPPKDPGRIEVITFMDQITALMLAANKVYERSGDMPIQDYHRALDVLRNLLSSYIKNGYRLTPDDQKTNLDGVREKSAFGLLMVAVDELKKRQMKIQDNKKALIHIQKEIGILIKGCEGTPVSESPAFAVIVHAFEDAEKDIGVLLKEFKTVAKNLEELQNVPGISAANRALMQAIIDNIVKSLSFHQKGPISNNGSNEQRKKERLPSHSKDKVGRPLSTFNPPNKGTEVHQPHSRPLPSNQGSR